MIKNILQLTYKYVLVFLGLLMLSLFFWNRYVRERLPKEIPLDLTIIGILILVYICLIYLINIIALFVETGPKSKLLNKIVNSIYKPLKVLDETIKTNKNIKPHYEQIFEKMLKFIVNNKYIKSGSNPYLKIFIIFEIVPRIVIASALSIDVFCFHQLNYIYKVAIISLVILIGKYIKYSLKYAKEQYILRLESIADHILTDHIEPGEDSLFLNTRPVRLFIELQTDASIFENKQYTFSPIVTDTYALAYRLKNKLPLTIEEYQFTFKDIDQLYKILYIIMGTIIPLSIFIEEYQFAENYSISKYTKILIFSLYLICWSYILGISCSFADLWFF